MRHALGPSIGALPGRSPGNQAPLRPPGRRGIGDFQSNYSISVRRGISGACLTTVNYKEVEDEYRIMARAIAEIEKDIRALTAEEKRELLRVLIAELDTPPDPNVEKAWLKESQRRYRELVERKITGIPGRLVFQEVRDRFER